MKKVDPIKLLNAIVMYHGSRRKAAAHIGVSAMYLCEVLNGKKDVGPKLQTFLGVTKHQDIKTWYTMP